MSRRLGDEPSAGRRTVSIAVESGDRPKAQVRVIETAFCAFVRALRQPGAVESSAKRASRGQLPRAIETFDDELSRWCPSPALPLLAL